MTSRLPAQMVNKLISQGNEFYKQQKYEQAESQYSEALGWDASNSTAKYNLGTAIFRRGRLDESMRLFDELATLGLKTSEKAKAYYNKGVILSTQKKLEESIEAYKNSLRQDPNDKQARENLQKALLELKKKNPPPKKQDDKKKKQEQQQKKKQPQPKMNQKEAEQRLKLLEQKEKEVQQRLQKEKSKTGGGQAKDW
jgi:Ca-activated chloride channel family protein